MGVAAASALNPGVGFSLVFFLRVNDFRMFRNEEESSLLALAIEARSEMLWFGDVSLRENTLDMRLFDEDVAAALAPVHSAGTRLAHLTWTLAPHLRQEEPGLASPQMEDLQWSQGVGRAKEEFLKSCGR